MLLPGDLRSRMDTVARRQQKNSTEDEGEPRFVEQSNSRGPDQQREAPGSKETVACVIELDVLQAVAAIRDIPTPSIVADNSDSRCAGVADAQMSIAGFVATRAPSRPRDQVSRDLNGVRLNGQLPGMRLGRRRLRRLVRR